MDQGRGFSPPISREKFGMPSLHLPNSLLYVFSFHICNLCAFTSLQQFQAKIGYMLQNSFRLVGILEEPQLHIQFIFCANQLKPQIKILSLPNSPLHLLGYEHRFLSPIISYYFQYNLQFCTVLVQFGHAARIGPWRLGSRLNSHLSQGRPSAVNR